VITSEIGGEDKLELVSWMDAGDHRAKGEGGVTGRRRRVRKAILSKFIIAKAVLHGKNILFYLRGQVHYCKNSIKAWNIQIGTHRVLTAQEYWMLDLNSVCKLI
jgi:hypothetical protein